MELLIWAVVLLVASYAITALTMRQQNLSPAGLEDFDFPQFEDGTPQAVIFGDGWTSGPMVIWFGNLRTIKIKSSGKK